jgi:hypothetical protein
MTLVSSENIIGTEKVFIVGGRSFILIMKSNSPRTTVPIASQTRIKKKTVLDCSPVGVDTLGCSFVLYLLGMA